MVAFSKLHVTETLDHVQPDLNLISIWISDPCQPKICSLS